MSLQTLALSDPNNCCLHYPQGGRRRWTTWDAPTLSTTTTDLHSGNGLPTCMLAHFKARVWFKKQSKLTSSSNKCLNHVCFPQRCDLWDGEWQSTAADPSGSTSCFPFKAPHQWRLGEWAHGAPGSGHRERKKYLHHTSMSHSEAVFAHGCTEARSHLTAVSHLSFCSPGSSSQKKILAMPWPSLSPVHPPSWRHNTHRLLLPRSSLKT